MPKQCAVKEASVLDQAQLIFGFVQVVQSYDIKSLPVFSAPIWQEFLERVHEDLGPQFYPSSFELTFCRRLDEATGTWAMSLSNWKEIEFMFAIAADIDVKAGRMRLKEEDGRPLIIQKEHEPFAEAMFMIGWDMDGFYEL